MLPKPHIILGIAENLSLFQKTCHREKTTFRLQGSFSQNFLQNKLSIHHMVFHLTTNRRKWLFKTITIIYINSQLLKMVTGLLSKTWLSEDQSSYRQAKAIQWVPPSGRPKCQNCTRRWRRCKWRRPRFRPEWRIKWSRRSSSLNLIFNAIQLAPKRLIIYS